MSQPQSVTLWIRQLKSGGSTAAQQLWEVYFQRMVALARKKLEGARRGVGDEEDVALSAFKSFCLGARNGRFTQLLDSDNLWPLLMAITAHKSVDFIRSENRQKRGGTRQQDDDGSSASAEDRPVAVSLSEIISQEPSPDFTAEMSEHLQRLIARLDETGDLDLRRIALLKLDGYRTSEIAQEMGCVRRTVERKMQVIIRLWGKDVAS